MFTNMRGRKRFISREEPSSAAGGATSSASQYHGTTPTATKTTKAATLPANASPAMLTGISKHSIAHHTTSGDTRRSRSQHAGPRSQLGTEAGSRLGRSNAVESPGAVMYGSPRQSDHKQSLRVMRHDSASSSTSDVSSVPGNLASLRTDRPFIRDSSKEAYSRTKLSPSWVSGHMTYPGRRSASNESDRVSDMSQQSSTTKPSNKFSVSRNRFLAEKNASVSPIIAHHIASPPENRRPIPAGAVTGSPSKARTLSSESTGFGAMARQKLWDKRVSKERSSLDSTASDPPRRLSPRQPEPDVREPVVAHAPARAKPFVGRANTVQLPIPSKDAIPNVTCASKSPKRPDRSSKIHDGKSKLRTTKNEENKVLQDIDNTIKDMTKKLVHDTQGGLSEMKGKSFDSQITPIAIHTTDSLNLATAGSTREERIFRYKQARRKELAKIANQGKSKSMELPETDKDKYLSEMEPHTPKFSRKYGSKESLSSKESLDEKQPSTFTNIAVPTQQIIMPSPILPKSVTSPPIATVSPIMASTPSMSSSVSPSSSSSTVGNEAITTVVSSHLDSRLSTSVTDSTSALIPTAEPSFSAFKPVKASSPTKIVPTSAPLDQLSKSASPVKAKSPVSPVRTKVEMPNVSPQPHSVPVISGVKSSGEVVPSLMNGTSTSVATTTESSVLSPRSPTKSTYSETTLPSSSELLNSSSAMNILPSTSTSSAMNKLLMSSPFAMVTSTLTTSMTTSVTTTTASVTSPLTSVKSVSSSDIASTAKRHILKKQKCVEESDSLSSLKQFVMTPAAIARAERKLSKSKSDTAMFLRDHDPKQSANAYAEKTFLEKSRRTSRDIEKWEDLIMNVADMQQELENIEFKIKQSHSPSDKASGDKQPYKQKVKQSDKNDKRKEPIAKHTEQNVKKEQKQREEIQKPRERTSPEKSKRTSPEKKSDTKAIEAFDIDQLLRQEAGDMLQNRKKLLQREDSFNRPDSPIREPMPLPKESVIKRNRLREVGSSSSSEGGPSPQRSPRVSPRVHRRKKPHSSGSMHTAVPSNMLTVDHAHHREAGGRRDPNRYTHQGAPVANSASGVKEPRSDVTDSSSTALISPPPVGHLRTSPATSVTSQTTDKMGNKIGQPEDRADTSRDPTQADNSLRPGSAISDSSTASSRRERRRFRSREAQAALAEEKATAGDISLSVRPGKRDKSSKRKSALNSVDLPDGEQESIGVTSPISSVPPDVTSPTSSLTSGMVSPLDKPSSSGMATPLSTQTITSPGNMTSPTQKASSSGVISPGYSSGMISPTYRHSADVTSPGIGEKVTSPQRHSAEFTFGTCYGPPRKSPSVTSPVTSPTQKSAPGVTSPIEKTPTPTGGVTSPTQRFQQGVLSPTQAAIQNLENRKAQQSPQAIISPDTTQQIKFQSAAVSVKDQKNAGITQQPVVPFGATSEVRKVGRSMEKVEPVAQSPTSPVPLGVAQSGIYPGKQGIAASSTVSHASTTTVNLKKQDPFAQTPLTAAAVRAAVVEPTVAPARAAQAASAPTMTPKSPPPVKQAEPSKQIADVRAQLKSVPNVRYVKQDASPEASAMVSQSDSKSVTVSSPLSVVTQPDTQHTVTSPTPVVMSKQKEVTSPTQKTVTSSIQVSSPTILSPPPVSSPTQKVAMSLSLPAQKSTESTQLSPKTALSSASSRSPGSLSSRSPLSVSPAIPMTSSDTSSPLSTSPLPKTQPLMTKPEAVVLTQPKTFAGSDAFSAAGRSPARSPSALVPAGTKPAGTVVYKKTEEKAVEQQTVPPKSPTSKSSATVMKSSSTSSVFSPMGTAYARPSSISDLDEKLKKLPPEKVQAILEARKQKTQTRSEPTITTTTTTSTSSGVSVTGQTAVATTTTTTVKSPVPIIQPASVATTTSVVVQPKVTSPTVKSSQAPVTSSTTGVSKAPVGSSSDLEEILKKLPPEKAKAMLAARKIKMQSRPESAKTTSAVSSTTVELGQSFLTTTAGSRSPARSPVLVTSPTAVKSPPPTTSSPVVSSPTSVKSAAPVMSPVSVTSPVSVVSPASRSPLSTISPATVVSTTAPRSAVSTAPAVISVPITSPKSVSSPASGISPIAVTSPTSFRPAAAVISTTVMSQAPISTVQATATASTVSAASVKPGDLEETLKKLPPEKVKAILDARRSKIQPRPEPVKAPASTSFEMGQSFLKTTATSLAPAASPTSVTSPAAVSPSSAIRPSFTRTAAASSVTTKAPLVSSPSTMPVPSQVPGVSPTHVKSPISVTSPVPMTSAVPATATYVKSQVAMAAPSSVTQAPVTAAARTVLPVSLQPVSTVATTHMTTSVSVRETAPVKSPMVVTSPVAVTSPSVISPTVMSPTAGTSPVVVTSPAGIAMAPTAPVGVITHVSTAAQQIATPAVAPATSQASTAPVNELEETLRKLPPEKVKAILEARKTKIKARPEPVVVSPSSKQPMTSQVARTTSTTTTTSATSKLVPTVPTQDAPRVVATQPTVVPVVTKATMQMATAYTPQQVTMPKQPPTMVAPTPPTMQQTVASYPTPDMSQTVPQKVPSATAATTTTMSTKITQRVITTLPSMPTISTVSTAKVIMATSPTATTTPPQIPVATQIMTSSPATTTPSPGRALGQYGVQTTVPIQQQPYGTTYVESTAPRFTSQEQTIVTSPVTQQPSVTQAVPQSQSASPYDNVDEDATRGNDVSSLVRRFSGSDYDNKERSPTPKRTLGGSTLTKVEISALREESPPKSQRTPERTQSLRERESPLRTTEADQSQVVKRAASFRDPGNVAMRRRFHGNTGKADEELQSILNRRSRHLEDWEEAMAKEEVTDQEKAIEEYERKLEQEKKNKPPETIIVDSQVADIFKQRRQNVEKHVVESEPSQSGESGSEMRVNYATTKSPPATTAPVLRDSNKRNEVRVTKITPQITPVKQGAIVDTKRDISPKQSLSKSTPDVRIETQMSVSSISMAPLRTDQGHQASRQIQLQRTSSSTTPPVSGTGKENIQPHLRKAKTFDSAIADPELMTIMRARRDKDPTEESEPDKPEEQIGDGQKESEEEMKPKWSIQDRIFAMESKIEEDRVSGSLTSSGFATPRLTKLRSSQTSYTVSPKLASPKMTLVPPEEVVLGATGLLGDPNLMAKLEDVAMVQDAARVRRHRFQQKQRDDWRAKTAPVTEEELHAAELEAEADATKSHKEELPPMPSVAEQVQTFTSLKKTPDVVSQSQTGVSSVIIPQAFTGDSAMQKLMLSVPGAQPPPQPIQLPTEEQPPEPEEASEDQDRQDRVLTPTMMRKKMLRQKAEERREALFDESSTDFDSDFDKLVEINWKYQMSAKQEEEISTFTRELDVPEEDHSKVSHKEKIALFKKYEAEAKEAGPLVPLTPKSGRRFTDRKKRLERSKTQPVTEEEVTLAAQFAKGQQQQQQLQQQQQQQFQPIYPGITRPQPEVVNRARSEERDDDAKEDEDELSKLSLVEKMQLFQQKQNNKDTAAKRDAPVTRRRKQRVQSRFRTQPITPEEVEKASKISPLAMSLVKPPDPELLQGLSLKEQREYMAQHAERTLSQTSLRKTSLDDGKSMESGEIKSILKPEQSPMSSDLEVKSILKSGATEYSASQSPTTTAGHGILKEVTQQSYYSQDVAETRGILKKEKSLEAKTDILPERGVLKKETSFEARTEPEKGVLKKESTFEKMQQTSSRSILKDSSFESGKEVEPAGILKSPTKIRGQVYGVINGAQPPLDTMQVADTQTITMESASVAMATTVFKQESGAILMKESDSLAERTIEQDRFHSIEGSTDDSRDDVERSIKTQEKEEMDSETSPRASIAERLSQLQQRQQDDWKRRIGKSAEGGGVAAMAAEFGQVKLREKPGESNGVERPTSIADRMSLLQGHITSPDSPLMARRKQLQRAKSTPTIGTRTDHDTDFIPRTQLTYSTTTDVEVPQLDEAFASFYEEKSQYELSMQKIDVTLDDFDHVLMESSSVLQATRKLKPSRKAQSRSKNPLKALRNRENIKSEYSEVRSNVADKEVTRIKREQIAGQANFAQEALAGLASKENFSQILLKKTEGTVSTPGGSSAGCDPYRDVMLLHIKGRRHCQMRLVEPSFKSINSGDAYLLVTSNQAYAWVGDYCNVIEKAKASELSTIICQKHDLGYRSNAEPHMIPESKQGFGKGQEFWKIIGGQQKYLDPGPQEEDELYEMYMAETNKVYIVQGDSLVPHEQFWGATPKYEMLESDKTLVLDFGSEMYVWTGKMVPFNQRKSAIRLAKELWDMGYDYSGNQVNPLSPMRSETTGGLPLKGDKRPDWALFGKVNENMETILFREKFLDWPDQSRLIKVKGQDDEKDQKADSAVELQICDVDKMVDLDTTPVSFVLEASHVGRGSIWVDDSDGLRREFEILTLSIQQWHILEYDHMQMDENSYGQFHEGDTYVVRWHYVISQKGMKDLKGQSVRHSYTGRERCAYFFWQGRHSSITEKGASALMTVELDEERGPQVRVVQGKEPPCFVQLFRNTGMIVHIGKREEEETNTKGPWKMYTVRNELQNEGYLVEIPISIANLRSCTSILLLNIATGTCYIWHGAKSPLHTQQRAFECAECIKNRKPIELGIGDCDISILEMREGNEPGELWNVIGSKDRSQYYSLLKDPNPYNVSPRLFHFTSASGTFEAVEILNTCRNFDLNTPFPFYQSDLYKASQPALLMLDMEHVVYVWQGWWPDVSQMEDNVETGSAPARFNKERLLALETTLLYCKKKYSYSPPPAYLVYAGLEPLCFTNMFPLWEPDPKVNDAYSKEGKQPGEMVAIDDLLNKLNKTRYTWQELQERPLPEGVDPLKMEAYLHDSEFERVLQMSPEEFSALPAWKQSNIKKDVGLF